MINVVTCLNKETSKNHRNNFYLGHWCYDHENYKKIKFNKVLNTYHYNKKS